ncbi:hypothetical protein cce_5244 (plasmid) [Crocosphaera subtropica ATCC 51142]|uniref:Uncharacterized protein n=1 Tax=Crocosphaera subtropica (strain ATCC 51142 / BH68) TaxID=43989 RepID=B1X379_CROS5|nr:hypothetical protein cce_5244 [Crocosphaera subtropica ATCC 51142]
MKNFFRHKFLFLSFKQFLSTALITLPIIIDVSPSLAQRNLSIEVLSDECRTITSEVFNQIRRYQPTREHFEKTSVDVARDYKGNYSIGFSALSGEFGSGERERVMLQIAQRLAPFCPQVALVSFSGPTWSDWTMRRDGFSRIHYKDEQFPGDWDFYWNWNKLPFDYDPLKNYFPD